MIKKLPLLLALLLPFAINAAAVKTTATAKVIFREPSIKSEPAAAVKPGVYWGAFTGGAPYPLAIADFEKNTGKKLSQLMWFLDWNSDFPVANCEVLYKAGYIPHLTWEPWLWSDKNAVTLDKILAGQFDSYIETFAKGAKTYGKTLFLRMGHEFNGDWYPWAVSKNGNDPEKYKKAYIRIHDIFTKTGADNVQWIWAPNCSSVPDMPWNDPMLAYPGGAYVNWIGIDGYNFGTSQSWSKWSSFSDIFSSMYNKLAAAIPGKPFMISEFACATQGGDKASWVLDLEKELRKYPRIISVVWFNENKESDWRVNSSPEVLKAFQKTLSSPYFLSSAAELETAGKNTVSFNAVTSSFPAGSTCGPKIKPDNKRPLMLVKTVQDAVIDGIFNEKIKTDPLIISSKDKSLSGKIYMGYDSNSIYLFADINDSTPGRNQKKGGDIWDGDALEITMSTDPDADPERKSFGTFDFQIGIKASDNSESWNFTKKAPLDNSVMFYTPKKGGYTIEAFIPWYNFNTGCFCRIKNKAIAFNFAIDNAVDAKGRKEQVRWTGNEDFYKNPSQWGQIIFSTEP